MRNVRMSRRISLVLLGALATQYGCDSGAPVPGSGLAGGAPCQAVSATGTSGAVGTGVVGSCSGSSSTHRSSYYRPGGWGWFGGWGGSSHSPTTSSGLRSGSSTWSGSNAGHSTGSTSSSWFGGSSHSSSSSPSSRGGFGSSHASSGSHSSSHASS